MNYQYVKCNGKARVDKEIYTEEQVTSPSFKNDYGRLVPAGYIVFDFDEQPYINIMYEIIKKLGLKCKMLITTKGRHFMFKTALPKVSDHIKEYNWLGLKCDVKACGTKENKESYQSIKINKKTREEKYINCSSDAEIDFAPKWLYIVPKKKNQIDLTKDQTGGRNNLFHSELMIKTKKDGFSYEEYCQMAHIINDYVLPNGLDENELNTAIRQEEWENLEVSNDKIILLNMALDVIEFFNCKIHNGTLIFFDEDLGHYSSNENTIFHYIQEKYAENNLTKARMKEVIAQMEIQLNHYKKYQCKRNSEYIVCGNKLVSMWQDDIKDITRTIVTDIVYPYTIMSKEELENYKGIGYTFLNQITCGNKDIEKVICECLGCMLAPETPFGVLFVWYGSGANGKSVLIKVMKAIMGNLLTNANILKINDRFSLSRAYKGIANVTDDVGITTLKETGLLKSIIDGTSIEVDRKNIEPIDWIPTSQFIMCCNEIPKIDDTTGGMLRRLSFVPFDLQLKENEIDRDLINKLLGKSPKLDENEKNNNALRYIMTKGILAFREAYNRGKLTELEKQKELLNDFKEENKSVYYSFYDYLIETYEGVKGLCEWIDGKTADEVYGAFTNYMEIEIKGMTQRKFSTNFRKLLPSNIITKNDRISKFVVVKKYFVI